MTVTIVNPRFENTTIVNEFDECVVVWSERRGCFYQIARDEFLSVWRDLHRLWMAPYICGALRFGSGRETVAYSVREAGGELYPPNYLRTILEIGVALEWVVPSIGKYGYSVFNLRPIRYEHLL